MSAFASVYDNTRADFTLWTWRLIHTQRHYEGSFSACPQGGYLTEVNWGQLYIMSFPRPKQGI